VLESTKPRDGIRHQDLVDELQAAYDDKIDVGIFRGRHHARYFRDDTTYHIIARTLRGFCLMRPDPWFNDMAAGVLGRAQHNFPSVRLYAFAFMSSHFHFQLRGTPREIPQFVGFIKGEISRRLGQRIGWDGPMWDGRFLATALPTPDAELSCLEYILSHGVKENLVARSTQWPGLHAAKQLRNGSQLRGSWLDGTSYGRAKYLAERRTSGDASKPLNPRDYCQSYEVHLAALPAWEHLSDCDRRGAVRNLLDKIAARARAMRGTRKPLGVSTVLKTSRQRTRRMPPPPWFEARRKLICWASRTAPATRAYLDEYWRFQLAFRQASEAFRKGDLTATFPPSSCSPPMYRAGAD